MDVYEGPIEVLHPSAVTLVEDGEVRVYLSRRNLETLLSKLDANKAVPGTSQVTLVKHDTHHPMYPQTHPVIVVTGVEDEAYYIDREPGFVLHHKTRRPN